MQRILVLAAALALGAIFTSDGALAQKKGDPRYCTMEGCIANCGSRGGQPRKCPAYCTQKISERKAAGKC